MNKIWTIIDIVRWGTNFFDKNNIESARLNIELILCDVLDLQRIQLYTQFEKPLSKNELDTLRDLVIRRAKNEPLQYLLSSHYFLDIKLKLNSNVLIPRPETEILAMETASVINKYSEKCEVLEIGTGSGCIAIYLAKHCPNATITAIDLSEQAIQTAEENARDSNLDNIKFFVSDILNATPKKKYDVIVSNPPYISEHDYEHLEPELMFEPKMALSDNNDGYTFYRRFSDFFFDALNDDGCFLLEVGAGQAEKVENMFSHKLFEINIIKDFSNISRIVKGKKQ